MTGSSPDGDDVQAVVEALYTLAAVILATNERQPVDLAAKQVAHMRHEVHHALREWAPPPDSYRARDLTAER